MALLSRIPGLRQIPQAAGRIRSDTILYDSWRGQFSDNPRAIFEELMRRDEPLQHAWVLDPALGCELPDGVVQVAPGSQEHLAMMGRARYLVANNTVPGFYRKREGTTFLQTWHGTPLKKIGINIPRDRSRASRQAVRTLHHNVERWDLLVSPNRFSTPIFREAFGYSGPIVETGYPRTDLLLAPQAPEVRAATRTRLEIAEGQRAVLYAPTYRDNTRFSLAADVDRLAAALGDTYVVLLRTHNLDAGYASAGGSSRYREVSDYADNRELYLAADMLITDYSSVMFDFAVTRKPMLFFTYDLEAYRDELRGFYFDFEAEAPGPLLSTIDAVVGAVRDIDAISTRYEAAYQRFADRFCHLDDGRASERVVDALLDLSVTRGLSE